MDVSVGLGLGVDVGVVDGNMVDFHTEELGLCLVRNLQIMWPLYILYHNSVSHQLRSLWQPIIV